MVKGFINLIGGYTKEEVEKLKQEYEETINSLKDKIDSMPLKLRMKYGFTDYKVKVINDLVYCEKLHSNTDTEIPELLNGTTLLLGSTGCGKDHLIKKYFEKLMPKKVLFIGREYEFTDKFGYLSAMGFNGYEFNEDVEFFQHKIFIGKKPSDDKANNFKIDYKKLLEILNNAIKDDYLIVLNEIDFKEDYYSFIKDFVSKNSKYKANSIITTLQTFSNIDSTPLEDFDNLILMNNFNKEDIELFDEVHLKDMDRGEYIYLERIDSDILEKQ